MRFFRNIFHLIFIFISLTLWACGGESAPNDSGKGDTKMDVPALNDTNIQDLGPATDTGNQPDLPLADLPAEGDVQEVDQGVSTDEAVSPDLSEADEGSSDEGTAPEDVPTVADLPTPEDSTSTTDTQTDTVSPEEIPVCVPDCDGKSCGFDGCEGICGLCPDGSTCGLTGSCEIAGLSPFGGPCHITEDCQPTMLDALTGEEIANPVWPSCLNSQCEDPSALCMAPYGLPACAKVCNVSKDDINNASGESIPDNIDDPDVVGDACEDSFQGVVEGEWSCVALSSSFNLCSPGVDFKPCDSNADCFGEESCQILNVGGGLEARCMPKIKEGFVQVAKIGDLCEENPFSPNSFFFAEEVFCESQLCLGNGIGCTGYCFNDGDCANFEAGEGCVDGACAKNPELNCTTDTDCSNLSCQSLLLSSSLGYVDDICFPKQCSVNSDCPDPDSYCRTFTNGQPGVFMDWEHLCLKRPDNTVGLGESCNGFPTLENPGPVCENPIWCIHGYCGTHCSTDDDCDVNKGQRCIVREFLPDATGDGFAEKVLIQGVCGTYPHEDEAQECANDGECIGPDSVCVPILTNSDPTNQILETQCVNPGTNAPFGSQCGVENSGTCGSQLCFNLTPPGGSQATKCTAFCQDATDCGTFDFDGVIYPSVCRSISYSNNGTFSGADNVYLPVCVPAPSGSTLTTCANEAGTAADASLCGEGEMCQAYPIITDLESPSSIDFRCIAQTPGALSIFGDDCLNGDECLSGYCVAQSCASLCDPDLEEPCGPTNESCDPLTLVSRSAPAESVVTTFCMPGTSPPIEPPVEDASSSSDSSVPAEDAGAPVSPDAEQETDTPGP
jgi:hypothetical protein